MEWLAPLQSAGTFLIAASRLVARVAYYVTIPLHYPVYYAYALVAFLLSPFLYMFYMVLGAASFVMGLVARLKYLYLYLACAAIIGICAGCMLHGTSSFLFVLLGVDSATQQQRQRLRLAERRQHKQQQQQRLPPLDEADEDGVEEEDDDEDEGQLDEFGDSNSNFSGESSVRQYSSSLSSGRAGKQKSRGDPLLSDKPSGRSRRMGGGAEDPRLDAAAELFENRWKLLRSSEKPRRRRRGLLAQTIHEESSESDFT
ncbi:hypothetical protein F5X99DRAFT_174353 [Biscogniauxia marginata]|nr:hypothetical protein F5X99DRAFT_174353 [Biscogniauxia marginata]